MKKAKAKTKSFVLTLPLRCEIWQRDYLDRTFKVAGNMYNNLVANRLKELEQMERTKKWKSLQDRLSVLYDQRDKELEKTKKEAIQKKYEKLLSPLYEERKKILRRYRFTQYDFQALIQKWRRHYESLIGTHVAQKIADAVWKKFEAYFFKNGKRIEFCPWTEFLSIEGKNNKANITYEDGRVYLGKAGKSKRGFPRKGIPVQFAKAPKKGRPASSAYMYEQEAISNRVKFCRIIRRWYPEGWRYFVQLVLEGDAPIKRDRATGKPLHSMGTGRVGHDIGPQTLASCGDKDLSLVELAPHVQNLEKELRRINRAMDRSRRAMNPQMFKEDGTIVPKNQLPPECKTKRGKRAWKDSKRYRKLAAYRRYLYRKQADLRIQEHNELANKLLAYGNVHYIETMRFSGLAKKAAPQKKEDLKPGEKFKCRKRFGKSIANKAPASFVNILERKVIAAGGSFHRINTQAAKASQYNHLTRTYIKKELSQRWNYMPDGRKIQRDIYSSFLLKNTNDALDGFVQELLEKDYPNFVKLHDAEINRLRTVKMPKSAGL